MLEKRTPNCHVVKVHIGESKIGHEGEKLPYVYIFPTLIACGRPKRARRCKNRTFGSLGCMRFLATRTLKQSRARLKGNDRIGHFSRARLARATRASRLHTLGSTGDNGTSHNCLPSLTSPPTAHSRDTPSLSHNPTVSSLVDHQLRHLTPITADNPIHDRRMAAAY